MPTVLPLIRASALVRPSRFSIVNPDSLDWGVSDWFTPCTAHAVIAECEANGVRHLDTWTRASNGLPYARSELVPSVPMHRTDEGFRLRLAAESCAMERADAIELSGRHPLSV